MMSQSGSPDGPTRELTSEIVRMLKCNMCLQQMLPPIRLCDEGHMICRSCRTANCVECNGSVTRRRNFLAESVGALLTITCRHCGNPKSRQHEDECPMMSVECRASEGAERLRRCGWSGPKHKLVSHVHIYHNWSVLMSIQLLYFALTRHYNPPYTFTGLLYNDNELFWVTLKVTSRRRMEAVQFVGSSARALCFRSIHQLRARDRAKVTSFFCVAQDMHRDAEDIIEEGRCYVVDSERLRKFCVDEDGHILNYSIRLVEVPPWRLRPEELTPLERVLGLPRAETW